MSPSKAESFVESYIQGSLKCQEALLALKSEIAEVAELVSTRLQNGGRIYTCGNGGSACEAMHLSEELVARYLRDRPGIPCIHLTDPSTITCWANDYEFETVFSRQVETFVTKKDVFIAFTTSGNSKNMIVAIEKANERGALTVGMLGKDGGAAKSLVNNAIIVPGSVTSHIQEAHMLVVHMLVDLIEVTLFPDAK